MPACAGPYLTGFTTDPFAAERLEHLLAGMTSSWPRRGRRLLAVSAAAAPFLENLWQAGFDLTVQDQNAESLNTAGESLKNRATYILGVPDHLPVDDCAFDYVVALVGPDDCLSVLLPELRRVACRGVLLLFASAWSAAALECRLHSKRPTSQSGFLSPRIVRRDAREAFAGASFSWGAVLPGPTFTWKSGFWRTHINAPIFALPMGAIAALRLDMGASCAGTHIVLRAGQPVASAE